MCHQEDNKIKKENMEEIKMLHLFNSIVLGLEIVAEVVAANGLQIFF